MCTHFRLSFGFIFFRNKRNIISWESKDHFQSNSDDLSNLSLNGIHDPIFSDFKHSFGSFSFNILALIKHFIDTIFHYVLNPDEKAKHNLRVLRKALAKQRRRKKKKSSIPITTNYNIFNFKCQSDLLTNTNESYGKFTTS